MPSVGGGVASDADDKAIATRIARRPSGSDFPPIDDRSPYGRHLLVGGTTLLPTILRDQRAALAPEVPATAFDATIAAARAQLRHHTARLEVAEKLKVVAGPDGKPRLRGALRVHNLAGHKLPTGCTGGDKDFGPGGDGVHLDLPLPAGTSVSAVGATLLFQVVSPRWAADLLAVQTPETAAFGALWQAADVRPEVVDERSFAVGGD